MNKTERKKSIEGLRGITVVMIVLFHVIYRYQQLYGKEQFEYDCFGISKWGEVGVSVFLMISAFFLIENEKKTLVQYVKNKLIRLWPQYVTAISLIFILTRFIYLPGRTVTFRDYILNCFFINGFIEIPYVDGAHWYLTVLIGLYIVYAISSQFDFEKKFSWCIIWILLAVTFKFLFKVSGNQVFDIIYRLLGGDFVGLASWGIVIKQTQIRQKLKEQLEGRDILIIFIVWVLGLGYAIIFNSIWRIIGAILGIVLLHVCVNFDPLILRMKPLVFLGTISYPLYLIHQNLSYIIMIKLETVCSPVLSKMVTLGIIIFMAYLLCWLELRLRKLVLILRPTISIKG